MTKFGVVMHTGRMYVSGVRRVCILKECLNDLDFGVGLSTNTESVWPKTTKFSMVARVGLGACFRSVTYMHPVVCHR